jgi:uncharacterized membrane protein
MKLLCSFLFVLPVCCALGCNESPPGGPNAGKPRDEKTNVEKAHGATGIGTSEDTFKISLPMLDTAIKQGDRKTVKIGIVRGKNFEQDVRLDLGKLPNGITATPAMPSIKQGDKDAEITLEASKEAALGEHTISVVATPGKDGASTTADLKIEVKKP